MTATPAPSRSSRPSRIILCGDSIFDNGVYVAPGGQAMHRHLARIIPDWTLDFRAVDGDVARDVTHQLIGAAPAEAVVMSVGGNDALGHAGLLQDPRNLTLAEWALVLAEIQDSFRHDYRGALRAAKRTAPRLLAATIYRPRFHLDGWPEAQTRAVEPLLSVFNDVIQEEARAAGAEILDLRAICVADADFANPIEPSDRGGARIARAVADWLAA